MTGMWLLVVIGLATLGDTSAAAAQGSPDLTAQLIGEWRGSGVVTGRDSTITMTWSREVGGTFLRLQFRNDMAASETQPALTFEGHGYYRVAGQSGRGTWFDSRGLMLPVLVTLDATTFTSDWGDDSSTERGRTTYRLAGANDLEVVDYVAGADGGYREFGRSRLQRVSTRR